MLLPSGVAALVPRICKSYLWAEHTRCVPSLLGIWATNPAGMPCHCAHPDLPMNSSAQPLRWVPQEGLGAEVPLLRPTAAHPTLSSSPAEETLPGTVKHSRAGREARTAGAPLSSWCNGDASVQASLRRYRQLHEQTHRPHSPQNGAHVPGCATATAASARGMPGVVVRAGTRGKLCPAASLVPSPQVRCPQSTAPHPHPCHGPTQHPNCLKC